MPEHCFVSPSAGPNGSRADLLAASRELSEGVFPTLSENRLAVQEVLNQGPDASLDFARDVYASDESKTFRNAYVSKIMEKAWPLYHGAVTVPDAVLYESAIDSTPYSAIKLTEEEISSMPAPDVAKAIASSNTLAMGRCMQQVFAVDGMPEVSADLEKSDEYGNYFEEIIAVGAMHRLFRANLPPEINTSHITDQRLFFIDRGLKFMKTHYFGLPNLIDQVVQRSAGIVSSSVHRTIVETTLQKSMPRFYRPTLLIADELVGEITDTKLMRANPDRHKYIEERKVVVPDPAIITAINRHFHDRAEELPITTHCPVAASDLGDGADGERLWFNSELANSFMRQLDRWYYPRRSIDNAVGS